MLKSWPVKGKQKAVDICNAFIAGAPVDAEGHVFYGVNETNVEEYRRIRASGDDWYYIDNSYFDRVRGNQFRVTKNAVQLPPQRIGEARSNGRRFQEMGVFLSPWRDNEKGYVLLAPQSPNFMRNVAGVEDWLRDAMIYAATRWPNHTRQVSVWNADKLEAARNLVTMVRRARVLLTHSSAAAITALIEGVNVDCSLHAAAAYAAGNDSRENRLHLMQVLADNLWTLTEIKQGKAWSWLNS
jgi:hypothetical protein